MLHVLYTLFEQGDDVVVFEAIEDFLAFTTRLDEAYLSQTTQVVRNAGLTDAHSLGQGADIQLVISQYREDTYTAGVAESAKQFGYVNSRVLVQNVNRIRHRML